MLQFRSGAMAAQRQTWPSDAVPDGLAAHLQRLAQRSFDDYGSLAPIDPIPLDLPLALLGLVVALAAAWREQSSSGAPGRYSLFLCWVLATYAGSVALLGWDSEHYYAPVISLNVVLEGLAHLSFPSSSS